MPMTGAPNVVAEELFGLLTTVLHNSPRDLSLTALSTLAGLERTGPRRVTDLAAAEKIAQPSMTTLVTNLERAGLLERRREESDGRVTLVCITTKGSSLLAARRSAGAATLGAFIDQLPTRERAALDAAATALANLRTLQEQHRDDPGAG